jgi:ribosomal protein L35
MPKMKTNRSASKRFRVTPKGKVMFGAAGLRHNLENMSGKNKRRQGRAHQLPREHPAPPHRQVGKR